MTEDLATTPTDSATDGEGVWDATTDPAPEARAESRTVLDAEQGGRNSLTRTSRQASKKAWDELRRRRSLVVEGQDDHVCMHGNMRGACHCPRHTI